MTTPNPEQPHLSRVIGPAGLAVATLNLMIGGGIYRMPAAAAAIGGRLAPVAYLVSAALMSLVIASMFVAGRGISRSGGPYAYVVDGLGRNAGLLVGVLSWLGLTLGTAAISAILGDTVATAIPAFAGVWARAAVIAVVFGVLAAINIRGVGAGHRTNVVFGVLKTVPLLAVILSAVWLVRHGAAPGIAPTTTSLHSLLGATSVVVFMFVGIEMAVLPSGEIQDDNRTIPLGVGIGYAALTIVLVTVHIAAAVALGPALATSKAPLLDVVVRAGIPGGAALVLIGTCVSVAGCVAGVILSTPRLLYAMAEDGLLPRSVARIHERYRTPHIAIVAQVAVAWLLAATSAFEVLVSLVALCCLLTYALCALAAFRRTRSVKAKALALATVAAVVVLAAGTGAKDWLHLVVVVGLTTGAVVASRNVGRVLGRGHNSTPMA